MAAHPAQSGLRGGDEGGRCVIRIITRQASAGHPGAGWEKALAEGTLGFTQRTTPSAHDECFVVSPPPRNKWDRRLDGGGSSGLMALLQGVFHHEPAFRLHQSSGSGIDTIFPRQYCLKNKVNKAATSPLIPSDWGGCQVSETLVGRRSARRRETWYNAEGAGGVWQQPGRRTDGPPGVETGHAGIHSGTARPCRLSAGPRRDDPCASETPGDATGGRKGSAWNP